MSRVTIGRSERPSLRKEVSDESETVEPSYREDGILALASMVAYGSGTFFCAKGCRE